MAAAYIQRCDVKCVEYLDRYIALEEAGLSLVRHGKLHDYSLSVASSLSLSLREIEKESSIAVDMLWLLCFIEPDQMTKPLLHHLLNAKNKADKEPEESDLDADNQRFSTRMTLFMTCGVVLSRLALLRSGIGRRRAGTFVLLSLSVALALAVSDRSGQTLIQTEPRKVSR